MEPLNRSNADSFGTDPDAGDVGFTARDHAATVRPQTDAVESTGRFGIGPKKLAKFADTDASHPSAPGRDT
jgi:hypothetical protein